MTNSWRYLNHTAERSIERYGLNLTSGEYAMLSAQIAFHDLTRDEGVVKLCYAGDERERWAVWFKGEWLPVLFDTMAARIVTILPKQELRNYQRKLPW